MSQVLALSSTEMATYRLLASEGLMSTAGELCDFMISVVGIVGHSGQ